MDLRSIAVAGPQTEERGEKRSAEPRQPATVHQQTAPTVPGLDIERVRRAAQESQAPVPQNPTEAIRAENPDIERRKTILKIKAWATAFPDVAGKIVGAKAIDGLKYDAAMGLLNEIRFAVGARTSSMVTSHISTGCVALAQEILTEHAGLKLNGPKVQFKQITQSKDFQDLVTETTLDNMEWIYQKPEARLLAYLGQAIWTIHSINQEAQGAPSVGDKRSVEPEGAETQGPAKRARVEGELPAEVPLAPIAVPRDASGFEVIPPPSKPSPPKGSVLKPVALPQGTTPKPTPAQRK